MKQKVITYEKTGKTMKEKNVQVMGRVPTTEKGK
jgi:hypothetical protein